MWLKEQKAPERQSASEGKDCHCLGESGHNRGEITALNWLLNGIDTVQWHSQVLQKFLFFPVFSRNEERMKVTCHDKSRGQEE